MVFIDELYEWLLAVFRKGVVSSDSVWVIYYNDSVANIISFLPNN